jgi:ubiquinone/menaquinone biosynthesis C-methylase UbiE
VGEIIRENLMDSLTDEEKKIQDYYDNIWMNEIKINQKYMDVGYHYGFYDKGFITYYDAAQNMNNYIGTLLGLSNEESLKILDVGCGVAATSRYLAKRYPNCHFTGISLGTEEIKLAQKRQKEQQIENVIFFPRNYTNTRFQNNSFNNAFAIESIVYAVNKKDVITEISRVLKHGGKFVIIDAFLKVNPPWNPFLNNLYDLDLQKRAVPTFITLQEMISILESEGFSDITIHDLYKIIKAYYFFGGFFYGFTHLFSSQIKQLMYQRKIKSDNDSKQRMLGAALIELLLGVTKKLGYYSITAKKI